MPDQATFPVPAVYAAISEVARSLSRDGIGKDRKNQQQNYQFRGIDDIYNAIAPMLANARLCILPRVLARTCSERASKTGGTLFYTVVEMEFDFVAASDGSRHVVKMFGEAMDSADKSTNKAMSAAYKYACLQTFCIPTEGDNDADATTPEPAASQTSTSRPDSTPASARSITKEEWTDLRDQAEKRGCSPTKILAKFGFTKPSEMKLADLRAAHTLINQQDSSIAK